MKHTKIKTNKGFVHYKIGVIEEGKNFLIASFNIGEENSYYAIYYKIGERFFYTISTLYAMNRGSSVLTTREIEEVKGEKHFMQLNNVALRDLEPKEKILVQKFISIFTDFISKHPSVRVRDLTGNYEWYIQDAHGRKKWN